MVKARGNSYGVCYLWQTVVTEVQSYRGSSIMIAVFQENRVSSCTDNSFEYLEKPVSAIATGVDSDWSFIHEAFRSCAEELASSINIRARHRLEEELEQGRELAEAKEKFTRRAEFSRFREKLTASAAENRRALKLFHRFRDWSIDKLMIISSAVNIYTLCQPKFDEVVQQLFDAADITKEFVKNLVKQVRDQVMVEKKKKQDSVQDEVPEESVSTGWRQDPSGGGRHYQLPPMYNEEAGMKVERLAALQDIPALKVVEKAIASFGEEEKKAKIQFQEDLQEAVDEMRDVQIEMQNNQIEMHHRLTEMQQELEKRDQKIAELEATIRNLQNNKTQPQPPFQLEMQVGQGFAVGDRIIMIAPWPNGDQRDVGKLGTIARIKKDGKLAVRLDNTRTEIVCPVSSIKPY